MKKLSIKKVKGLSETEMSKILGGEVCKCEAGADSKDCTSELASGGGTTDSYSVERKERKILG